MHDGGNGSNGGDELWRSRAAAMFARFDKDGSGCLDADELLMGLVTMGVRLKPSQGAALRDEVDEDCNGALSLDEFITAVRQRARIRATRVSFARHSAWLKVLLCSLFILF